MALDYQVPLLGDAGPLLIGDGLYLLVPSDEPFSGTFTGGGAAATSAAHVTVRLPKVRRRGLPGVYTRRADQIERNNQKAMELTRLIVEELTADD